MKVIKNQTEKLFNIIKFITNFLSEKMFILYMALPLITMDIITRLFGYNIDFYSITGTAPNLFTLCWVIFFLTISICFKKKIGKKIYLAVNILFIIIFLINNIYYSMTRTFFDFNLLESTDEGAMYILDAIINCNPLVYLSLIIILIMIYIGYKKIPYTTKNKYTPLMFFSVCCLIIHSIAPQSLGKANSELTWSTWQNPRNNYIMFNDSNKSMKISGLYEYTFRNFYITFLKTEEEQKSEDKEFLEVAFSDYGEYKNKYSGIFKDKNLILIQLEGMDNWLINKNDTPTLYKMMNSSYNFTNHYSYYNGGGSTFNSEFAVNTGFITPLSYTQNAYTFNKNSFPYSLANQFKKENYTVNAFHMNTGEYYSRTTNYLNWGYDNYYGLIDIDKYEDESYTLDRELILNEQFNELMFPTEQKFVDYIITYSGHLPFSNTKGVCKELVLEDIINELGLIEQYNEGLLKISYENNIEDQTMIIIKETIPDSEEVNKYEVPLPEMTEEQCVRRQAKETDYMMELLLQNLEEKNLIDNTVIVVFTDHYLYTLKNKDILSEYKDTSNNLINKTPFFIWANNTKYITIKEVTSQLNILPTVLNLYGLYTNPNYYIGEDALNNNYNGIVFFSDYSWYDGNVYVTDGKVTNNKNISYDKLEEKNFYINYVTRKNDLSLKFNYFKQHKKDVST